MPELIDSKVFEAAVTILVHKQLLTKEHGQFIEAWLKNANSREIEYSKFVKKHVDGLDSVLIEFNKTDLMKKIFLYFQPKDTFKFRLISKKFQPLTLPRNFKVKRIPKNS